MGKLNEYINKKMYGEINWSIENKNEYIEFSSSDESQNWGNKHYRIWADAYKKVMDLSKRVMKVELVDAPIECYCGYSYRQINQYLRNDLDNDFHLYREMADILAMVLCSAPRIPCNLVVFRLVNNEFINRLVEQNKNENPAPIQEKGFMSTSLVKNIVNEDEHYAAENNLLKIYVDKDAIGVYVNAVTSRSEEELLLYPNGFLGLIEYPYYNKESGKTIYECKFINFYS